ncbi:nuclear transport factor 2 family protein [Kordiimonas laminariae]|uniref:nuclear transport factor 2 family protein n=1 Tax=Kordiimonas laminariae TaxID=2917717 RepID=UPI001FF3BFBA|nr:nuclear transport factor 2 family protein [Kordiimonas laminariae]MCK0068065.1 nuclear transport factor 2 family protein [Kordiimonas laminariae]
MRMLSLPTVCLLALSLIFTPAALASPEAEEAERKAVEAAVNDYILGFYRGELERLEKVLAPDMRKLGWWRGEGTTEFKGPYPMTKEAALKLAPKFHKEQNLPEDAFRRAVVLDVMGKTASAKAEAMWGIDYIHLAKEDGKWIIHNIIWQSWPTDKQ